MTARALLLAGSAALLAVPAGAAVGDFRLPPGSTPTPTPTVVGPVDPERPVPRATPTPTPAPRATVTPAPTPAPVLTLPPATSSPRAAPTARPTGATSPAPAPAAAETGAPPQATTEPTAFPTFTPPPQSPPEVAAEDDAGGLSWPWIAGFGLLVALLAAGWLWLRRRMMPGGTVLFVPEIEKPRVPQPEPESPPGPPPAALPEPTFARDKAQVSAAQAAQAAHPLHIAIEPLKLTQTVMNATLAYKLKLTNRGEAPLGKLSVAADLVAAHASLPREALQAAPDSVLPERHAVPSLAAGETIELKGELRLPLAQAMPIRQGQAVVFVPLARFRAAAEDAEPRCFTVVVGQPSPRGAIQPIRLDLGPRSTEGLTGRAF